MTEIKEELKSLLMKVKQDGEKAGLKQHSKMNIMPSGPITSWQTDKEKVQTMTDFIFLGSKITTDGDCSHEIKKTFALWKESYDRPRQHIKRQRHHSADKGLSSQSYGFPRSHVWI